MQGEGGFSLPEPPERTSPKDTLSLAQENLFQTCDIQNYKGINVCCFQFIVIF